MALCAMRDRWLSRLSLRDAIERSIVHQLLVLNQSIKSIAIESLVMKNAAIRS